MGGGKKYGSEKDHTGHCIFAYQKKDDKKWGMVMTLASALRTSLEGYSERELRIMPLVCCSIAGMGVCYSYIPDEMIARVIPAGVPQIYSSKDVEIELGELKEADAVIQAAKEGFIKACEEGGTRHWFTRQLLMALDPDNGGLTFCNAWMIQNAKARYLIDCWLEGKVMATLEKSAKDLIVPPGTGPWDALALKPHDEDEEYRCDELKTLPASPSACSKRSTSRPRWACPRRLSPKPSANGAAGRRPTPLLRKGSHTPWSCRELDSCSYTFGFSL